MKDWKNILVSPETTIRDAIGRIDTAATQVAIVADPSGRLLGVVTDGDIRRAVLRGHDLGEPVSTIMCTTPVTASPDTSHSRLLEIMLGRSIHHVPLVDASGIVLGLKRLDALLQVNRRENLVVLMAGGLGKRLRPLTEDCPKPMLQVGAKPILEHIIENFAQYGFYRFLVSVNYKSDVIQDYFGDGAKWQVQISYLKESRKMGTAGALSLIKDLPAEPFYVMNGDVLTTVNFLSLLDFHRDQGNYATMCVREYDFQVPYGVVETNGHQILRIVEKPVHRFYVNAGIYLLEPSCLQHVPKGTPFDMPTLFETLACQNFPTAAFPLREHWLDIGRLEDFERACREFPGSRA